METSIFFSATDDEQKITLKSNGDIDIQFSSFEDSVSFDINSQIDWSLVTIQQ